MIDRLMQVLDKALGYFLAFLMAAMVIDVSWQVITRFVLGEPSAYTEELARFLLIWIGILGAAYSFRKRAHLGLDLFVRKLEPPAHHRADVTANLCCLILSAVVFVYGAEKLLMLVLELVQTSAAVGDYLGYVYGVLAISGVMTCLYAIDNIRKPGSTTSWKMD